MGGFGASGLSDGCGMGGVVPQEVSIRNAPLEDLNRANRVPVGCHTSLPQLKDSPALSLPL